MKVLFISYTSLLQKMYQRRVVEISKYCSDIRILTPLYWKEIWRDKKVVLEGKLMPDRHITGSILFKGNLHLSFFVNKFAWLLRTFKPDIIDMEDEPFNFGSLQLILWKKIFTPKSKVALHASQNIFKNYPFPFNAIEKYVLRETDLIFARTEKAKKILELKRRTKNIYVVPHGVDTGYFKKIKVNKELYLLKNSCIIGFIGALTRQKGVDILIKAVALIKRDIGLLIIGDGPEKEKLERLAGDLDIREKVRFIEACEHRQIVNYLNIMDICVLPSLTLPGLKEKFGRVILEAMACGVPVIGSSSGEIPDVIGDNGLIFKEGDINDLKDKIVALMENERFRKEIAERGRKFVENNYSWSVIAKKTVSCYRNVLV